MLESPPPSRHAWDLLLVSMTQLPEAFASLGRRQEGQRRKDEEEEEEEKIHKVKPLCIKEGDLLMHSRYSIDGAE